MINDLYFLCINFIKDPSLLAISNTFEFLFISYFSNFLLNEFIRLILLLEIPVCQA